MKNSALSSYEKTLWTVQMLFTCEVQIVQNLTKLLTNVM